MRNVRNPCQQLAELFVQRFGLLVKSRHLRIQFARGSLPRGSVDSRFTQLADLLRFGLDLRLQLFGLSDRRAALSIKFAKRLNIEREAAIGEARGDGVAVRAEDR